MIVSGARKGPRRVCKSETLRLLYSQKFHPSPRNEIKPSHSWAPLRDSSRGDNGSTLSPYTLALVSAGFGTLVEHSRVDQLHPKIKFVRRDGYA